MLWFGAAISIAEIQTGALLAPLGMIKGIIAILIGHLIGCGLFYFIGLIGAKSNKNSMESTEISFGRYGSIFFSVLNILQLIGWTAVMIFNGAEAMNQATGTSLSYVWCLLIGLLIIIWVLVGLKNISKLNFIAVGALFILCIVLCFTVFKGNVENITGNISFGLAIELSIAMPLSWLPLISDYTKDAEKPYKFTLVSTLFYFIGSCFMYVIGLGASIFAGTSDIVAILTASGVGIIAMIIVILSTVTTTFLDVYSVGESAINIFNKINSKIVCIIGCVIGILIAIFVPILQYENFLYIIGSVFVPMATIMIANMFFEKDATTIKKLNLTNCVLWIIGFVIYRVFLHIDTILGSTIPVVIILFVLCFIVKLIKNIINKKENKKNV